MLWKIYIPKEFPNSLLGKSVFKVPQSGSTRQSMTISISVALQPTGSEWAESKHWAGSNLLNSPAPSLLLGGVCVDWGLWGPLSAWLQGLRGDCCHLLWTDFSPGQAAGQWGENVTGLVCNELTRSAYTQQVIAFNEDHLHNTTRRHSKCFTTARSEHSIVSFTAPQHHRMWTCICHQWSFNLPVTPKVFVFIFLISRQSSTHSLFNHGVCYFHMNSRGRSWSTRAMLTHTAGGLYIPYDESYYIYVSSEL